MFYDWYKKNTYVSFMIFFISILKTANPILDEKNHEPVESLLKNIASVVSEFEKYRGENKF